MSLFPDDAFAHEQPMVLVASVDGPTRIAVARAVAHLGLTALIALDGAAAVVAAQDYEQALLGAVLDAHLPTLSGWDVAHTLRSTTSHLPLVVLSDGDDIPYGHDLAHTAILHADDRSGLAAYLSCLAQNLTVIESDA